MKKEFGFTLVEVIVTIVILAVLASIAIPDFLSIYNKTRLDNNVQEFVSIIKAAQNKALSSENYSQYGVYVDPNYSSGKYTLFQGTSYDSRNSQLDRVYYLDDSLEFYNVNLSDSEIVFDRLTGASAQSGDISVRSKQSGADFNKTIYISSAGVIDFKQPLSMSDDDRLKDSRHVELTYSRNINTTSESMVLTFNDSVTQTFLIDMYLLAGQIHWQGTVNVNGSDQTLQIDTLRLNDPDTLFSIRRDRRYNDKSLKIGISGDTSGTIAEYSADGLTTTSSSIYVSNFIKR